MSQAEKPHMVAADIGGTHARFARVTIGEDNMPHLGDPVVLKTSEMAGIAEAWEAFLAQSPGPRPTAASLAVAAPVGTESFKLTNNHWHFNPSAMPGEMQLDQLILLNDFEAVAHAVARDQALTHLARLAGPAEWCAPHQCVSIVGPGTGLGIAYYRWHEGSPVVQATEGAHIGFAPDNAIDDAILARLRRKYDRVSLERVLSGDGIAEIYAAIAADSGQDIELDTPLAIWMAGMAGDDAIAVRSIDHFITMLGRLAGDYALAHGSHGVVIAGGLGLRLHDHLSSPTFHEAFLNKGRYRAMMERIPIRLITHPQPGLLGAATAFLEKHG